MVTDDLTEAEIIVGALRVYYPPEDRMIYVHPMDVICMRDVLHNLFELTPSEWSKLKDKAVRLEQRLIELGR